MRSHPRIAYHDGDGIYCAVPSECTQPAKPIPSTRCFGEHFDCRVDIYVSRFAPLGDMEGLQELPGLCRSLPGTLVLAPPERQSWRQLSVRAPSKYVTISTASVRLLMLP